MSIFHLVPFLSFASARERRAEFRLNLVINEFVYSHFLAELPSWYRSDKGRFPDIGGSLPGLYS